MNRVSHTFLNVFKLRNSFQRRLPHFQSLSVDVNTNKNVFSIIYQNGKFYYLCKKNGESNCQKYITGILERA